MADQTLSQADCAAPVSRDRCDGCDRLALLVPLHDPDKGGPLRATFAPVHGMPSTGDAARWAAS
jgi:hypothetical protein